MKAVIYARVSSREQEETGYSLPAQERLLEEYSHRKNLEVVKVFSVAESASGAKQRKVFAEMMGYMEKHSIPHLLCEKVDRLTRNLKEAIVANDWLDQADSHTIHFVKQNLILTKNAKSDEKFRWDIEIIIAKKYTSNLSEEVKKGLLEKLRQGHAPRRAIAGYKTVGEKGHKIHVIDEEVAPFIRRLFTDYATGNYSMSVLGEKLFKEGFRSFTGKKASKSRIEDILKNPYYYGAIPWTGELHIGVHEPLISKELFDKVQGIRLRKDTPKYQRHQLKFRKLLKCGECGGTITGEIQKGHVYYHCNHYRGCAQRKNTREEVVEEKLMGVFKFFEAITPAEAEEIRLKIKENHAHETQYKETAMASLQVNYNRLQRRLDALYDDRLDGKISPEFWEKKNKEILGEQAEVLNQLNKLKSEEAKYFEIWLNIIDLARRAREIYERRTPEERRLLLSHIFSNLVLKDGEVAYTLKKSVQKVAERVQQKLDAEKSFEPTKTLAKKGYVGGSDTGYSSLLALVDDFRTINWAHEYPYPSIELKQIKLLLS